MSDLRVLPVLLAPTASGKKDLVLRLLEDFPDLRVIFCDSRKLYRELEIGTAKPPKSIRGMNAFMVDLLDLSEQWDAHRFAREAWNLIEHFLEKGDPVLITAGTPLYLIALHRGLFPAPPPDPALRQHLERQAREHPNLPHRMLQMVDPPRARKLHPRDHVRILRALEVFYQTGVPMSLLQKRFPLQPRFQPVVVGIHRPYRELRKRIEDRVDDMVRDGLFEETRALLERYPPDAPGFRTTGYRELLPYFEGKISREEAVRQVKRRTWEYARQQLRFFRGWMGDIPFLPFDEALKEIRRAIREIYGLS